jgi:hypothetical protein
MDLKDVKKKQESKCGIYTQWNIIQPQKNEILSFAAT